MTAEELKGDDGKCEARQDVDPIVNTPAKCKERMQCTGISSS